ncbi:hypothetical protein EXIGLDRAFT_221165 [Exidia glandulosa HHB12029]|uniref:Uncharacterized protein n=1 Tax=Exidia glandulosa HHB12029 TaxID=1314781 RepID=A0A165MQL8_EXIGL|nr:hypothetical protein EXIGLDRAFT_221165 [Exidia glandulosa HHB12029]
MAALLLPSLLFAFVARAVNVTIDDASSSWSYAPADKFCHTGCRSEPDAARAFGGTWHDCTVECTATLTFTGTEVSIYTICPPALPDGTYLADLTFSVDNGRGTGTFKQPQACPGFAYNQQVYSIKGLSLGQHTIVVTNHPSNDPLQLNTSNLLLDYAVIDDGTSAQPSSSPTSSPAASQPASPPSSPAGSTSPVQSPAGSTSPAQSPAGSTSPVQSPGTTSTARSTGTPPPPTPSSGATGVPQSSQSSPLTSPGVPSSNNTGPTEPVATNSAGHGHKHSILIVAITVPVVAAILAAAGLGWLIPRWRRKRSESSSQPAGVTPLWTTAPSQSDDYSYLSSPVTGMGQSMAGTDGSAREDKINQWNNERAPPAYTH